MSKKSETPVVAVLDGIPVREFTGFPQLYSEIGEGGTEDMPLTAGLAINNATLYFFVGKGGKRKFAVSMQDVMSAFCDKLPKLLEAKDEAQAPRRRGAKVRG